MECTRARRFFLVRVIGHDVVEINLGARDVLLHDTPSSPVRLDSPRKYIMRRQKTKLISPFKYTGDVLSEEGNKLIVEVDQRVFRHANISSMFNVERNTW